MPIRVLLAIFAFLLAPIAARAETYTRSAEAGAIPPRASITDAAWLTGAWEGTGIEGAPSQESWAAPLGGMMHGTFVQGDGKGGVMFTEHMQIVPDGASLKVRLKHFGPDLVGWEEKDKSVSFPLIAVELGALYFNGLTYRRDGRNRLLVAVRMKHKDGTVDELVFRFRRVRG